MNYKLFAASMLAISAATFLPAPAMAQVELSVVIGNAPPPARFESAPPARPGYVWAPGYWNWEGQRHAWVAGHWEAQRVGQQFRHAEWLREQNGWRLDRGGWVMVGGPAERAYVEVAPPPPRYERIPRARHGYQWAPGHWEWHGQRHEWVPGIWIAERHGHVYQPPRWEQRDGHWQMQEGRWERRDNDRDGVPNRYDRDRDGDGVPNRYDNHPDNPRRD